MSHKVRRATGFWHPFNKWYREQMGSGSVRPSVSAVREWYNEHSASAWGSEEARPGWQETLLHASGLRTADEVKKYNQNYKAKRVVLSQPAPPLASATSMPLNLTSSWRSDGLATTNSCTTDTTHEDLASMIAQHNQALARMGGNQPSPSSNYNTFTAPLTTEPPSSAMLPSCASMEGRAGISYAPSNSTGTALSEEELSDDSQNHMSAMYQLTKGVSDPLPMSSFRRISPGRTASPFAGPLAAQPLIANLSFGNAKAPASSMTITTGLCGGAQGPKLNCHGSSFAQGSSVYSDGVLLKTPSVQLSGTKRDVHRSSGTMQYNALQCGTMQYSAGDQHSVRAVKRVCPVDRANSAPALSSAPRKSTGYVVTTLPDSSAPCKGLPSMQDY